MPEIDCPFTISEKEFVYFSAGDSTPVIIDAPHASGPPAYADEFTGNIADYVSCKTGAGQIVSLIPRNLADLNRKIDYRNGISVSAHRQHRDALYNILFRKDLLDSSSDVRKPLLYISLHGMTGYSLPRLGKVDIEIGTRHGMLCNYDTASWVKHNLQYKLKRHVVIDKKFVGDPCLCAHIHGEGPHKQYRGYGLNIHLIQLEISRDLRFNKLKEVCSALIDIVRLFRLLPLQSSIDGFEANC